ncbi:hypothetical protein GGX14DRAFT_583194 [Mycena pura]|uniref:Uncharacterized protein n=1 Tax=Mycena pura TaxID=153505 RepID=A0AAD7E5X0_9AGAR|nr:hypothetical protein GGX14DRAFT_583194 [Mycena pura]
MQLKTISLPLVAVLCALSLSDVRPVAAAFFPANVAVYTVAVHRFTQQYAFADRLPTEELDPEDFWQRARELGDRARRYGGKLLKDAADKSQDVREKIGELTGRMDALLRGAAALHEELRAAATLQSADAVSEDLERAFAAVLEELRERFPAPEKAPGHEARREAVAVALEKAGAALVGVCVKHGMDEERARQHWDGTMRPAVETVVVLLGDLVEQHPDLLEALLFTGAVVLIPDYWLLRPLLGLFGFGPTGPVKGTTASWAQRVFYGPAVSKKSWFALLDQAAMTIKAPGWWASVGGVIGVGLGFLGAVFGGIHLAAEGSNPPKQLVKYKGFQEILRDFELFGASLTTPSNESTKEMKKLTITITAKKAVV